MEPSPTSASEGWSVHSPGQSGAATPRRWPGIWRLCGISMPPSGPAAPRRGHLPRQAGKGRQGHLPRQAGKGRRGHLPRQVGKGRPPTSPASGEVKHCLRPKAFLVCRLLLEKKKKRLGFFIYDKKLNGVG